MADTPKGQHHSRARHPAANAPRRAMVCSHHNRPAKGRYRLQFQGELDGLTPFRIPAAIKQGQDARVLPLRIRGLRFKVLQRLWEGIADARAIGLGALAGKFQQRSAAESPGRDKANTMRIGSGAMLRSK